LVDIKKNLGIVYLLFFLLCCITQFIAIHKFIWFEILIDKSGIRSI